MELHIHVTNADHAGVPYLLARMAINLAFREEDFSKISNLVFHSVLMSSIAIHRKPLTALCRMILCVDDYFSSEQEGKLKDYTKSLEHKLAVEVCTRLVHSFQLPGTKSSEDYLFLGEGGWRDPGPLHKLGQSLATLSKKMVTY